jgi:hypothetical protein
MIGTGGFRIEEKRMVVLLVGKRRKIIVSKLIVGEVVLL